MDLISILLLVIVVFIACYLACRVGYEAFCVRPITGQGECGLPQPAPVRTKPSRGKTLIESQTVHVDVDVPRKSLDKEIGRFRKNATSCTPMANKQNICRETVEYYKKLRDELIAQDPDNADKTIIQRHHLLTCPFCIRSQPTWSAIMNEYLNGGKNRKFIFLDNNEAIKRTPGISGVPTIIKMTPDGIYKHDKSSSSYEELHKWIES